MRVGRSGLLTVVLAAATIGPGALVPAAAADTYGFTCTLDPGDFCIVESIEWREIYRVNVWYEGSEEIVIGAALIEQNFGEWGEARNRSNNHSRVTLDNFCSSWCKFKAKAWNWGPGRHTIKGRYWWRPALPPE